MSVRWSNDHKYIQEIDGLECTKATKWYLTSRPGDLYKAVSGGWGPIETLRVLLDELEKATLDVDPALISTIKQKQNQVCHDHNAKKELLLTRQDLPGGFEECIVSEWVSLMRWTWAAPELCFYRVLKNQSDDTWLLTLWAVPFKNRPTSRRDKDTGSHLSKRSTFARSDRPDAGNISLTDVGELTKIVDQLSLVSGLPAEASGLVSKG